MNINLKLWELEENDQLKQNSKSLQEFYKTCGTKEIISTHNKLQEEIRKANNDYYDELHKKFYLAYPEITDIQEIRLVKKVFDFLKKQD